MKPTALLLLPILTCLAHADTIRMRDGTEHEGSVVSETDDHYIVMVQVTKSIRDQRKFAKSDVLEIVEERKDEAAFEKIEKLVPTPDLLTLKQYERRTEAVEDFVKEFPKSKELEKASEMLKTLDKERDIVAQGGIKFEGKMIPANERESRAYPLDARIAAAKVTQLGDAGDITGALRAWTALQDEFSSSQAYLDTIPYARKMMSSHLSRIDRSLDTIDERIKEREAGLASVPLRDLARTKAAIADQAAAYQAKLKKEQEDRVKWPSIDPYHKQPMATTKRLLETEIGRLDRLNPDTLPKGDEAWNNAWKVLSSSSERSEVTSALSAVRSARMPKRYVEILEAKAPRK